MDANALKFFLSYRLKNSSVKEALTELDQLLTASSAPEEEKNLKMVVQALKENFEKQEYVSSLTRVVAKHLHPVKTITGALRLRQIKQHMAELTAGPYTVLFSYETPVAFNDGTGFYKTQMHYSPTTAKQISQWLQGANAQVVSQGRIDHLLDDVLMRSPESTREQLPQPIAEQPPNESPETEMAEEQIDEKSPITGE